MEYRVLGSLEVLDDSGHRLPLGGARQQTVLGSLLLRAGHTVPLQRLVDELWETPPDTAAKTVQVYVSRLRRLLSPGAIQSRSGGYSLVLDGDPLDLAEFEQLANEGRAALTAADCERAAGLLRDALSLWRGPALGGLATDRLRREAERLEELRLQVQEDRLEADLGRGRQREVVPELQALVAEHPFRERLRAQLMLALYRTGRQTEALEVYRETRALLAEELGLEPSAELRDLERRMLAQDPELDAVRPEPRAATVEAAPVRGRRPATVVFADVVNSTMLGERLDPESLHRILERYSDVATTILERHGGTAEKFIGDAIVGFFGLSELHEDDALRAVRAAVELRDAVASLREEVGDTGGVELEVKLGVNSGDVFVGGGPRRETFATGDSVNVAARLEQTAEAGEILLGERTYRLVESAVRAEPLGPLAVKGREGDVHVWRLLGLSTEAPLPHASPFIGREPELEELRGALARTREEKTCRLCTVVGPAGIGKSRLAEELLTEVDGSATVAVGRCLSYGEGITYHALVEIVKQLAGDDPDRRIAELIEPDDEADVVARRVRGAVGLSDETSPPEETFWAIRRLFETVARDRPLVAVVEDLHWGEPLLLDLLEYLAGFSADAPIFILCLARPELFETRPSWAAPGGRRSLVVLHALDEPEARMLVESIGPRSAEEAGRIVETAEGNPLFLEQLVATRSALGDEKLPPNVQAVLAARIAALEAGERTVLEHASVEGRNFRWSSLAALLPETDRALLGARLMALVRRQLIEPDSSAIAGEDAFRFSHVLIREAAYEGLPREQCAELHERLAGLLAAGDEGEDEIVGHHLEQAYRCRAQLGLLDERSRELAAEAQTRLEAAAQKLLQRGDASGAAGLLERAASLSPAGDRARLALLPTLGAALSEAGRFADADAALTEAIDCSTAEVELQSRARIEQQFVRLHAEGAIGEADRVAGDALAVFGRCGDAFGSGRAWRLKAQVAWLQGRVADADEAWGKAAEHARSAGAQGELFDILDWRASAALVGPTHVDEAIERCREITDQVRNSPLALAESLYPLAVLHAMRGEIDVARSLVAEGKTIIDELGSILSVGLAQWEALVEMLADSPGTAEERLRATSTALEEMGNKAYLATTAAMLAQASYAQGRLDDADAACRTSRSAASREDLSARVVWRSVRAKILAGQDRGEEAEALAREAVRLASETDFLNDQADAYLDLAEVLELGGRPSEAEEATRAGLALYERKGNVVSAARARRRLDQSGGAG